MNVHQITPLPIAIPLLTAAAIVITSGAPRRVHDAMAMAAAAAMTVICAILLAHAGKGPIVEWLGGWRPHHGVALGISLAVDQLGAGAAVLVSVLLMATLAYSWTYFEELDGLVHALMLVLTAAMVGVCLTGDLFTMVVFFVLLTVPAVGLTAVQNEYRGPLQGAINFAVVNSVAGFAALLGAALIYGRTGALNLAQIGRSLDHHPPDALVAVAFGLLIVALLTKAGATPFHFWLPDAHAVAPTPVSALFSGAMVVTALFGLARILATAFAPPLQTHANGTRALLVGVGAVTAVIGASGCFEQRHVKRLLAFVTVSQVGLILCGIGLLGDRALAGAALAALATGLVLAALFGVVGVLLRRYQTADEYELAGRGRDLPFAACVFAIGALLLVPLPPGVGFRGVALIATAARSDGYTWLPILLAVTSAVSAGTLLRAGGRVFLGLGVQRKPEQRDANEDRSQEQSSDEEEAPKEGRRTSPVLIAVPALLLALAVVLGVLPGFAASVEAAAAHFRDVQSYTAAVLRAKSPHYAPVAGTAIGTAPWLYSAASLVGAVLVATTGLRGRGLLPTQIVDALRGAHSGHVGDYVAWWTFGLATFGALALWAIAG